MVMAGTHLKHLLDMAMAMAGTHLKYLLDMAMVMAGTLLNLMTTASASMAVPSTTGSAVTFLKHRWLLSKTLMHYDMEV